MRLIDKDALLEAIGEEYDDSDVEFMKGVYSQWKCDTDIIKSFPEISQGPEIVRCKDCKHCEYPKSEKEWCKKGHLHGNAETWFCADGERR